MSFMLVSAGCLKAETALQPVNDRISGTLSGRIQSLSMYRDFESGGKGNGVNSTVGIVLGYRSDEWAGVDAGLSYLFADEIHDKNHSSILANDDINVLNEAWLRYQFNVQEYADAEILAGRKVNNGEVFRADDFRQKPRSIEAVQLTVQDLTADTVLTVGHALRMSNWIQAGDRANFNNFSDVFGTSDDTDGITWAETLHRGIEGLEIALFDAYAWDVVNLAGTRVAVHLSEHNTLTAYYRNETDAGNASAHTAEAFGLSFTQKAGRSNLEAGLFSVHGNNLRFQELTTGINHPLGLSMEICSCPFDGGADTAYLRAVTKIGKTTLYGLYNFTWHDKLAFDGQEVNVVVKHPLAENLTVAFKGGFGYRDWQDGAADTSDIDTRIFITYAF